MLKPFERTLDIAIRARNSCIVIQTTEEERVRNDIVNMCAMTGKSCCVWDNQEEVIDEIDHRSIQAVKDPVKMLDFWQNAPDTLKGVLVLGDFHLWWKSPVILRKLKEVAMYLFAHTERTIISVTHVSDIPKELHDVVTILDYDLPGQHDFRDIFEDFRSTEHFKDAVVLSDEAAAAMTQNASGLTISQFRRFCTNYLIANRHFDDGAAQAVLQEKKEILKQSNALEYYDSIPMEDVGGLGVLKAWIRKRKHAYADDARAFGLPMPKGALLIGIPGTGKSLSAKAIASVLGIPLLHFDIGAIFGSLVGQSEERLRNTLKIIDTISPCVVWIDEIEKSLASGGLDGGVSKRVLGSILTWSQENGRSFLVATANDVSGVPPEMLRKGRFDEIFFVDVPNKEERHEILSIHIQKRRRNVKNFELDVLVDASQNMTGAEIEQSVVDALFDAYDEGREVTTEDIVRNMRLTIPLVESQADRMKLMREWRDNGLAKPASVTSKTTQNYNRESRQTHFQNITI